MNIKRTIELNNLKLPYIHLLSNNLDYGGSVYDPFPNIKGMIARYSAKGLTNEGMKTNPVWKDLTGNGHDLQMKNFAWAGMSGVGGYAEDYSGSR